MLGHLRLSLDLMRQCFRFVLSNKASALDIRLDPVWQMPCYAIEYPLGHSVGRRRMVRFLKFRVCSVALSSVLWSSMLCASDDGTFSPTERLRAQNAQFEKQIIEVAPNVYTGVGYGASNASMIVGDDGVVIVDTLPGTEAAKMLLMEFRKISRKPVKAIIYTHAHMDHIGGARVFAGSDSPRIIARQNVHVDPVDSGPGPSFSGRRAARQFGRQLKPGVEKINLGVGPAIQPMGGFGRGVLAPTQKFSGERLELKISGVDIHLVAAPGETDDQLYVWLPHSQVLFSGDNFYRSFPNIYALRGTPYRDVVAWADSLDAMSKEPAAVLVPGHTNPIMGADEVHQALTDYRDAIRFVHDKTLEGMNKGLGPDELVGYVKLPEKLASRPYLAEFYGRVDTSVRAVFSGYVGWFDGNPTHLAHVSPQDEAAQIASLVGGERKLLSALKKAQKRKDHAWALRLADHLISLGRYRQEAVELKADSLRALALKTYNAPTRNYFLSVAKELTANETK